MNAEDNRNEEKKKRRKDAARKRRAEIKNDPLKYEESKKKERDRYHTRKKSIKELSEKDQVQQRLKWKQNYYKKKKKINEKEKKEVSEKDGRIVAGKKTRRRNTFNLQKKIKLLEEKLKNRDRQINRCRMRLKRMMEKEKTMIGKNNENSPELIVENLIHRQNVSQSVKKNLLFGEVLKSQLKESFHQLESRKDKRKFCDMISGKIVRKYKSLHLVSDLISGRFLRFKKKNSKYYQHWKQVKQKVTSFFENDENSRLCPGKKDFISRKRLKKQKRYLNNCMKNLHKKFVASHSNLKISYSTFCRLKPFWVVPPVASNRDTTTCTTHANVGLITSRLKLAHVIEEKSPEDLCTSLCCENIKDECLERTCNECKNTKITPNSNFVKEDNLYYEKWTSTTNKIIVNGVEKLSRRTVKEKLLTTKGELFISLEKSVKPFFLHVRNIQHQYQAINVIKNNLKINDILIHIDFSENFLCKYSEEIQAIHFGGSKTQLSLHTVVVYHRDFETSTIKPICMCTVSDDLRHNAIAICAHLQPVIEKVKTLTTNLNVFHILSYGPSTQYKNKTIFHLIGTYLSEKIGANTIHWHYSETGHGKGAPDGVGGCIKRTADSLVAMGKDIPNLTTFINELSLHCPGIHIHNLDTNLIPRIEKYVPETLECFKGTQKVREVIWNKNSSILQLRSLTCIKCLSTEICFHYALGEIMLSTQNASNNKRLRYSDVYSDSDNEENEIIQDDNQQNSSAAKKEDYVLVAIRGKKKINKHSVGKVLIGNASENYTVKLMTKVKRVIAFVFPNTDIISEVEKKYIIQVLSQPTKNKKGQYTFVEDLSVYHNVR